MVFDDLSSEDSLLVKRACVQCPVSPSCPICGADEQCSFTVQTCSECPKAICIKAPNTASSSSASLLPSSSAAPSNRTNAGAIVGGVIGGLVVFFSLVAFLVWKYVYSAKARQRRLEREMIYEEDLTKMGPEFYPGEKRDAASRRATRYSTTTMSSTNTANGGGNVIPIAYIPGVFSRTQDAASSDKAYSEKYFSASDILRDSQYSHRPGSGIRSSIATTNYRGSIAFASDFIEVSEARPNLVNLDGVTRPQRLTIDTSKYLSGASSTMESPIVASAQAIDVPPSRIMNAKSVRIGKNVTGLQNQFIIEETSEDEGVKRVNDDTDEDDTDEDDIDNYNKKIPRNGSIIINNETESSSRTSRLGQSSSMDNNSTIDEQMDKGSSIEQTPSMMLNLRQSIFSDLDIKFEENNGNGLKSAKSQVSRSNTQRVGVTSSSASRRPNMDGYPTDNNHYNDELNRL